MDEAPALHLENLPDELNELLQLAFGQLQAPQLALSAAGGSRMEAGEEVAVAAGPPQELQVEVPAHRLLYRSCI